MSFPNEDAQTVPNQNQEFEILRFWKEQKIYDKSQELRKDAPAYVFYEGPPTANGLPHPGHCLTRAIKDLYPRYKTMRGFRVERKAGWDTHGLPVEVEVCKELGIHSKEEIEQFGVEPFVHRCIESVWRYTKQWEELTERIGFWIRLDEAYVTYHKSYVESVWWSLKTLFDKGLLYQGYKIVWWWAQGGTALSSGEVGQGYRQVADPSVFVRFPLLDDATGEKTETDLLVWTTTPWTLPSNQFAAVHPDLDYAVVELSNDKGVPDDRKIILAAALADSIAAKVKKKASIVATCKGKDLVGKRYLPPFDCYYKNLGDVKGTLKNGKEEYVAWRITAADFVTIDSGSGAVHEAPAFGEVDFDLLTEQINRFEPGTGPELICAVAPDGKFTADFPDCQGRWVKECDKDVVRAMKENGVLFHQEQYLHDYPFCWRAPQDPLIQYPRRSWFIQTQRFRDRMLENNAKIHWYPDHVRERRFGNFLASNIDWALSRERYWGTPLPIWVCEQTGYREAIGSYEELLQKPGATGREIWENAKKANPDLCDDLKVHKPYIDAITYDSPKAKGARMRRVPEVIDCWYDSGAMPFAQWGYPHQQDSSKRFADQFPADFISEAIDQTRGWFYSQLAISTLMFGNDESKTLQSQQPQLQPFPHPFKNCIVLGLMLGEDGQKMSKSLRNYREPKEIFDKYGADALRWYFYAVQTSWTSIRYSEKAIRESMPKFLLKLRSVWGFFKIYADIDGFNPAQSVSAAILKRDAGELAPQSLSCSPTYRPVAQRAELDRWMIGELHETIRSVTELMDAYDHFNACAKISQLTDSLSNWYVRRSRDRFWSGEESGSKADAYWTLYESLLTLAKLIAPFVPFLAEEMWRWLAVRYFGENAAESVHLCRYPQADVSLVDNDLLRQMSLARDIVSLGHNARMGAQIKVRQPLQSVEIVLADASQKPAIERQKDLIRQELNVKEVRFIDKADKYITYSVLPDFKKLGPKLGKRLPEVKKLLNDADGGRLLAELERNGKVALQLSGVAEEMKNNAIKLKTNTKDWKNGAAELKDDAAKSKGSTTLPENNAAGLTDNVVELTSEEIQIRLQAKDGWAAAHSPLCVVVLSTELNETLYAEGRARELVRFIQDRRKELNCDYTDRIRVGIVADATNLTADSSNLIAAVVQFSDYIKGETLAIELSTNAIADVEGATLNVDGEDARLFVEVVK
ncbi:MAG: isoleucine--tRNA ligase [Planctomycetaceae bacterium]|jgi:isoleucyl-tRNA synthetase|nr:isoleucine--tRNA ligase [Planctomycetaceae bacterium]